MVLVLEQNNANIKGTKTAIEKDYKLFDGYLKSIDISDDEIKSIRSMLIK